MQVVRMNAVSQLLAPALAVLLCLVCMQGNEWRVVTAGECAQDIRRGGRAGWHSGQQAVPGHPRR